MQAPELWENPEMQEENDEAAEPRAVPAPNPPQPDVLNQEGVPYEYWPIGMNPSTALKDMKELAVQRGASPWGTKAQVWKRLMASEKIHREARHREEIAAWHIEQRRQGFESEAVIQLPAPRKPDQMEIDNHMLHHIEFAEWCPMCVAGKGQSKAHHTVPLTLREAAGVPRIEMDYLFMRADGTFIEKGEEIVYDDIYSTHLAVLDTGNGQCMLGAVEAKGPDGVLEQPGYAAALATGWMRIKG